MSQGSIILWNHCYVHGLSLTGMTLFMNVSSAREGDCNKVATDRQNLLWDFVEVLKDGKGLKLGQKTILDLQGRNFLFSPGT